MSTAAPQPFLQPFAQECAGSVSIIMGISLAMMVVVSGMALDLGRAQLVKTAMQNSRDAAALAGALHPGTPAEKQAQARRFFYANYPENYLGEGTPEPIIPLPVNSVSISGSHSVHNLFVKELGGGQSISTVNAVTEVPFATQASNAPPHIIIVKDTSAYIDNGRSKQLIPAFQNFVDRMFSKLPGVIFTIIRAGGDDSGPCVNGCGTADAWINSSQTGLRDLFIPLAWSGRNGLNMGDGMECARFYKEFYDNPSERPSFVIVVKGGANTGASVDASNNPIYGCSSQVATQTGVPRRSMKGGAQSDAIMLDACDKLKNGLRAIIIGVNVSGAPDTVLEKCASLNPSSGAPWVISPTNLDTLELQLGGTVQTISKIHITK